MLTRTKCLIGGLAGAALIGTLVPCSLAMADPEVNQNTNFTNAGTTAVTLQYDSSQISVTAPATIPLALREDGVFVCPTNATMHNNNPLANVYVTGWTVDAQTAIGSPMLKDELKEASSANAWAFWRRCGEGSSARYYNFALTGTGAVESSVDSQTDWGMLADGVEGDTLTFELGGKMVNQDGTYDFVSSALKLEDIAWTFSTQPAEDVS